MSELRFTSQTNSDTHSTTNFADGSQTVVQTRWTIEEAMESLVADFLTPGPTGANGVLKADPDPVHVEYWNRARTVFDAEGNRVAVLMSPQEADELRDQASAFDQMAERARSDGEPYTRYRPFLHAPDSTPNRHLPTEAIHDRLAWALHKKKFDELEVADRDVVSLYAIDVLLHVELDQDSRGVIPIRRMGRNGDATHTEYLWSLGFATPVAGLFIAPEDGFFGASYTLMSGSGFSIVQGYATRELASAAAEAVATRLPGVDWLNIERDAFSKEMVAEVMLALKENPRWGQPSAKKDAA